MTDAEYRDLLARGKVTVRLQGAVEARAWRKEAQVRARAASRRVRTLQARTDPAVAAAYLIPEEAWREETVTPDLLAAWQADLDASVASPTGQEPLL